ncbi:hypothetical protein [Pseudoalteromonas luteoviolacea]|uniref:Adhesin domain-containing protein n=1 Tax=Pseudoalteromonas luteoviolacea DSM 6061 TaxID=1365250 RepID=A0A166UYP0_9GAMM|nr:hypothetical protein [Pseudoalteromonas luteoviolacea]KZN31522.1 hypothetical protein N475_23565 [Pseudoalteromonas luteoviolacea DSM 6061]KZN55911.1 hypothetical protein N474_13505 [Pseudoalteromonas luteoviolacea CPMOR-2]MBE0388185.1 hypothetical protein [Pseudoalteromonas luteoviolacea DSM 6061]TQF72862.1 hypothetical protein FLM44_18265 [Pseudoalteromonas luteoviolacea]
MRKLTWFPLFLSIAWQAQATQSHTIKEQFSVTSHQSLEIAFPVGKLNIETYEGDSIQVEIELRENDNSWFGKTAISSIQLEKKQHNDEIYLTIDEEDVEQIWHVKLPASLSLEAELGVGNVHIETLRNDAEIEVGVGNVKVHSALSDYQVIDLESGVGKTKLKNFTGNATYEQSMVGSKTKYQGQGRYELEVDVGVGNIKITH